MSKEDGRIMDEEAQAHIGARSHPEVAVCLIMDKFN